MEDVTRARVRYVYAAFLASGAAALVYEVTWTRALSLVLGSTTWALSTMLATFMSGLALGASWGGKLADREGNVLARLAFCELGIGLAGLVSVPLIYLLPAVYLALYRAFHLYPPLFFALQVGLCALVMIVPTFLMGATFPLVSRAVTGRLEELGRRVGGAYSFNTVGAVVGSLLAGFLLIPALGVRGGAFAAAAVNLAAGLLLAALARPRPVRAAAAVALLYLPAAWWAAAAGEAPSLVNYYTASRHLESGKPWSWIVRETEGSLELLSERSYAEGQVTAYRDAWGDLVLQVAGKPEGTGPDDREAAHLLAWLPLAVHPRPEKMLVVGLGAGVTVAAAKPHVADLLAVEIHPGVVEAVERFGPRGLLDGVRLVRDDARSFLMKTSERFDVIASAPSYPTEHVVSNLFTRELYEIAAGRLAPDGVFAQWLPYGLLSDDDVTLMAKTFALVFPHCVLWRTEGRRDLILLGGMERFAEGEEEIKARVAELAGKPSGLALSRTRAEMSEIARRQDVPVNTDDRPILEFRMARNLLLGLEGR